MSESEPIKFRHPQHSGGASQSSKKAGSGQNQLSHSCPYPSHSSPHNVQMVSFERRELNQILRLYGLQVARGEWRDYAIDMLRDKAVFSVFRRASEVPLYRIEKAPKLARKQGAFSIITPTGHILKRGRDLEMVLRVLVPKPRFTTV